MKCEADPDRKKAYNEKTKQRVGSDKTVCVCVCVFGG